MIHAIDTLRFLFVTGKGGTGKTTVAAALACKLATQGKRVLCAMCQAKERLSILLGGPPVAESIVELRPNIWAVNMKPESALAEYGMMVLRLRSIYRAVFENRVVKAFFRATPGLPEWAMLGKAWYHTTEKRRDGSHRFDVVILDAPSTGHGLDMLRGPKVIVDVAPPGLLRREATRAWRLFSDPTRSGVVVVTLAEEMPVTETLELLSAVERDLQLPVAQVVVNDVLPRLFSPAQRDWLLGPHGIDVRGNENEALAAAVRRAHREKVQHDSLLRLREQTKVPIMELPHLFDDVASPGFIKALADTIP